MCRVLSLLFLIATVLPTAAEAEFHSDLLEKGKAYYHAGQYPQAEKVLRIAAFGLLDRIDAYETSKIYLALTYDRLGNDERSRESMLSVFRAEEIRRTYPNLTLPEGIRSSFEEAVARILPDRTGSVGVVDRPVETPRQRVESPPIPRASPPVPSAPPTRVADAVAEEEPADVPRKSVEVEELEALREEQPDSVPITLALTDAHMREGNLLDARRWAQEVADGQPQNAIARIYLARISHREEKWGEAADHFLAADRLVTLTQDDLVSLLTALVAIERYADARKVATSLNEATLKRPAVASALSTLEKNFRPLPPTVAKNDLPPQPAATMEPGSSGDLFALMREARGFESSSRCDEAVRIYKLVLENNKLERFVVLAAAHGLSICRQYATSLEAYARVDPLQPGEESHMFRASVNFFETGNLTAAREYLRRALVRLDVTGEVREYRAKIGD